MFWQIAEKPKPYFDISVKRQTNVLIKKLLRQLQRTRLTHWVIIHTCY